MAEDNKGIKDPMKSGKDFGSPFDIFKAKLNKETVKSLKQPTGGCLRRVAKPGWRPGKPGGLLAPTTALVHRQCTGATPAAATAWAWRLA